MFRGTNHLHTFGNYFCAPFPNLEHVVRSTPGVRFWRIEAHFIVHVTCEFLFILKRVPFSLLLLLLCVCVVYVILTSTATSTCLAILMQRLLTFVLNQLLLGAASPGA